MADERRPLDSRHAADAVDPGFWNIVGEIDVFDHAVADPQIGVAVVDQQARLAHQTQAQSALHVHQHQREDHSRQAREQFAAVRQQCLQCE